ncbi:MAG: putative rane/secreted protein [Rhodoglobus sp.]|nr:putative rane/secreted protein [Rhodoglobus sp.]
MPRSKRWTEEDGSASLEFLTAGLVLLLPLVYLVLSVSVIQAAALAVEGAARQGARVFVQGLDPADAQQSAIRAVDFALADHGIEPGSASISVACEPRPAVCLTRQGFVTVAVSVSVPLPLVPPVLEGDFPLAVTVGAQATQQVSRFWGSG